MLRLALFVIASTFTATVARADWPQFRGPNNNGVVLNVDLPTEFGGDANANVAWEIPMPGKSVGGAIVVGDQVITTSSGGLEERRIYITSVDKSSGKRNWQQEFVARGRPYCHPTSANAAPTPCSDGEHIFAFYSSNDLICLDLQGNLVWYRSLGVDFPKAGNDTGMGASPIVADGVVVVQIECQGDSFAAGLDASTGKTAWRIARPRTANWASPLIAKDATNKNVLVLQSRDALMGYDLQSGRVLWDLDLPCSSIASSISDGGRLFAVSGGITALDFASDNASPSIAWANNKLNASNSSPLLYKGQLIVVNRSILLGGNGTTGEIDWKIRLPDAGTIWSTPVIAGEHLYLFNATGQCFVVNLSGDEPVILGTSDLGDGVLGSPAIDGDSMFVRSERSLWKIKKS
jgi:outer membrane protein assembly factor BamB